MKKPETYIVLVPQDFTAGWLAGRQMVLNSEISKIIYWMNIRLFLVFDKDTVLVD